MVQIFKLWKEIAVHELFHVLFTKAVEGLGTIQGRNRGKNLGATSAMVGRICPPWLG